MKVALIFLVLVVALAIGNPVADPKPLDKKMVPGHDTNNHEEMTLTTPATTNGNGLAGGSETMDKKFG